MALFAPLSGSSRTTASARRALAVHYGWHAVRPLVSRCADSARGYALSSWRLPLLLALLAYALHAAYALTVGYLAFYGRGHGP